MQDAGSSSVGGREVLGHRPGLNRCPGSVFGDASQALMLPVRAVGPAHGGRAGCRWHRGPICGWARGKTAWSRGRLGNLQVDRRGSSSFVTCHQNGDPLGFIHI